MTSQVVGRGKQKPAQAGGAHITKMDFTYPGVYIEEVESGVRPIASASTSTAAFIGQTAKGPAKEPKLIFKWADYKDWFGVGDTVIPEPSQEILDLRKEAEEAAKAVKGAASAAAAAAEAAREALASAKSAAEDEDASDADVATAAKIAAKAVAAAKKTAEDLAEAETAEAEAKAKVKAAEAEVEQPDAMWPAVYTFFLNGGGAAYIVKVENDADYVDAFASLVKIRDISIICLPGKPWNTENTGIIGTAISHADDMENRMVIVDLPENTELTDPASVTKLNLPSSPFSVTYYPWVEVANPFGSGTLKIAPSSFAAGMWAKIDGRRGVWKAPAGVETSLLGVAGLADNVDDNLQGQLNPLGINCIRKIPGAGPVIWGTRTLSVKAQPEWLYVPVRRTANMIRESIYNNIQWAVFEPNDHRLWSSLRVNIDAFMNGLWRAGAFQGEKADDAYFVRCNLGDTMEQSDIDLGKVIVEVGFAPLKPAEFVIVRIQQKVAQQ